MDRKLLGDRIRTLRKQRDWNQGDLAAASGVSERSLSDFEAGKGNPGLKAIEDLEAVFKQPLVNLAAGRVKLAAAPGPNELKAIVEDPAALGDLQLANLLAAQFAEAPAAMRALALRALFDRPELLEPYRDQFAALATPDRKKRLK